MSRDDILHRIHSITGKKPDYSWIVCHTSKEAKEQRKKTKYQEWVEQNRTLSNRVRELISTGISWAECFNQLQITLSLGNRIKKEFNIERPTKIKNGRKTKSFSSRTKANILKYLSHNPTCSVLKLYTELGGKETLQMSYETFSKNYKLF